jgi:hypothetical protein
MYIYLILVFILGLVIGSFAGIVLTCCMVMASRDSRGRERLEDLKGENNGRI